MLDPEATTDPGVPDGALLLAFVNAAQSGSPELPMARDAVTEAIGYEGMLEAAATIAVFNGLVRVADGTGIQVDAGVLADSADFRASSNVDDFAGSASTTTVPQTVNRLSVTDLFA